MRKRVLFNEDWDFIKTEQSAESAMAAAGERITLPHTWNAEDGQTAGPYHRGTCWYRKEFEKPNFTDGEEVWIEFGAAAMTAEVYLNGHTVGTHKGGYAGFRFNITDHLKEYNTILVAVDNSVDLSIYPQTADFTFYGGLYRDVYLVIVPRIHFRMDHCGDHGVKLTPEVSSDLSSAVVHVEAWVSEDAEVRCQIGDVTATAFAGNGYAGFDVMIEQVHLWNGKTDPYMYEAVCSVGEDKVTVPFGCRTFRVDPDQGFFLNGKPYHLHGVAKHQDWWGVGNATTREMMDRDMELIEEIGATTVRLSHYQHPQYFYDLCDRHGLIVWAEIPYITHHVPEGRGNTLTMMEELIAQNYHHPSIICWGLSNEISIIGGVTEDMLENHRLLNDLCHTMDKTRLTTMAHVNDLPFDSPIQQIPDIASYNLYFGWYTGEWEDNATFMDRYHAMYPERCIGLSEYGADANYKLQSPNPDRTESSESYQTEYHEHVLNIMEERPYIWATHVWNMFDFGASGRNSGGIGGQNLKGLVTIDRNICKDAFYLYKAHWTRTPMLHICGSRYVDRIEEDTEIKVFSNLPEVSLYEDGSFVETKTGKYVFRFRIPISGEHTIKAIAGDCSEEIHICKVDQPNPEYSLPVKESVINWFEVDCFQASRYSILDSINDLMANPATKDMTLEVLNKLDPAILEVPGLLEMFGGSSIQGAADRSDYPDCKTLLTEFNQELQKIEKN